ncbi:uncharacterized protein JN550_009717 [Neoarthrinium moseri]|uniref:uncharacterized protein n=1 Tax=Neoarthrinium moseri TaxID=1658444 RepID=UPI001FDB138B|nr:uncharacterized protein JN550_009717 [Neoarthrinium moseri]KAI1863191.1 hypothetical protein JN550_009717 [Neoarthrinium moseri]
MSEPTATTCERLPTSPTYIVVDPDGDLHLRVGCNRCLGPTRDEEHSHERRTIFVCESRSLSRASPVWKRMLGGPWKESRPANDPAPGEWTVDLPEDDPEAMGIMLNVIHSRFESLPFLDEFLSLSLIYKITVLTDKYALTRLLRPWAKSWSHQMNAWFRQHPSATDSHAHATIPSGDASPNESKQMFMTNAMEPPGLLDEGLKCRLQLLRRILAPYRDALSQFLAQDGPSPPGRANIQCRGLWPLPDPDHYHGSVRFLLSRLSSLNVESIDITFEPPPVSVLSAYVGDGVQRVGQLGTPQQPNNISTISPNHRGVGLSGHQVPANNHQTTVATNANNTADTLPSASRPGHVTTPGNNNLYSGCTIQSASPVLPNGNKTGLALSGRVQNNATVSPSDAGNLTATPASGDTRSNHRNCYPFAQAYLAIQDALASPIQVTLTDAHLRHLRDRAAKTGIAVARA